MARWTLKWPRRERGARVSTYDGLEAGYRYEPRFPLPEVSWSAIPGSAALEEPSYDDLLEQVEMLKGVIDVHADTYRAAEHLLRVMSLEIGSGPLFLLNEEGHSPENIDLIRHAVVSLQATIDGADLPALALNGRNLQ